MYTDLNMRPIFDNVSMGFSFEFFSPLSKKQLASKLSAATRKKIVYSYMYPKSDSVAENTVKLYPNFFGGFKMNKIKTAIMPYSESIQTALNIMNFIDEYGHTNYKCRMDMDIQMDSEKLEIDKVSRINVLKLMLNIDEGSILEYWNRDNPERAYKNSISYIYPKNVFLSEIDSTIIEKLSRYEFRFPKSKYFGLDLDRISENLINVRYVSGKHYQKKKDKVVSLVNDIVEKVYYTLKYNNEFSDSENTKMVRTMKEQRNVIMSLKTYENFKINYPDINIYVDLKQNDEYLKSIKYNDIKQKIFELMVYGGIDRGEINFDSDRGAIQIKNTRVKNGFFLEGVEFYDSYIEGDIKNCKFYMCEIRNSKLDDCTFFNSNNIKYSYINECAFHGVDNKIRGSYVKNSPELLIEADIQSSVIRSGTLSSNAVVDADTEILCGRIPA